VSPDAGDRRSSAGDRRSGGGEATPAVDDVTRSVTAVADRIPSPMVLLEPSGVIRHANPAAGWLIGRAPSSLKGLPVLTLVHPEDRTRVSDDLNAAVAGRSLGAAVEYRIRAGDGSWKTVSAIASDLLDVSSAPGVLVSATDVTEQRAQERSLRELAMRDPVTGLANRVALRDGLASEMAKDQALSVALIDLDHFKWINDCLGRTVGDAVLEAAGARIASLVPGPGLVAHFDADTFVVVLVGLDPERAVRLVWELIRRLANPLFIAGHELRVGATAGVVVRDAAATSESIVRDADSALTRGKTRRRGGVVVFTEEMRTEAVDRLAMETDLRHAVEHDELILHFQPIVRLSSGAVEGCEALARWARHSGEQVSPATFIPLAEETGLIIPIGDWVLNTTVGVMRSGQFPRVSVNLSPRQLIDPGLPARIERLLGLHELRPEFLSFEVTEAVLVENFELATESLNRLRYLGCPVGLDDFGTGYSSLSYLRRLPVDFLKLDIELVADVDTDHQAAKIADAIVSLARTLSLTTIAEGVERQSQADALDAMGCHYGQGWLFGRPAPA